MTLPDDNPTYFEQRLAELRGGMPRLTTRQKYLRAARVAAFMEASAAARRELRPAPAKAA